MWKLSRKQEVPDSSMKNALERISKLEETVDVLQDDVKALENALSQAQQLLKYMSVTQLELSADMSKIYKSLKTVVSSIAPPPKILNFPILGRDDDDDDLLN
jgi:predicted  nucleic acid-binding Zn-ribbon protein